MAIDERSRHQLYQRLEQVLGEDEATVLMEHLPPVGWADVATKRDLDVLEERLEAKMDAKFASVYGEFASVRGEFAGVYGEFGSIRGEFGTLRGEIATQFRTFFFAVAGLNLATLSTVFAITRL